MKRARFAALGVAALTFCGLGIQSAAADPMMMSDPDKATMRTCMDMSGHDMALDQKCTAVMQKMKVSTDDMRAMKACNALSHEAMAADQNCMTMMKMHGLM